MKVIFTTKSSWPDKHHYTSIDISDQLKRGMCTCHEFLSVRSCVHLDKLKNGETSILTDTTQKELLQIVLNFN